MATTYRLKRKMFGGFFNLTAKHAKAIPNVFKGSTWTKQGIGTFAKEATKTAAHGTAGLAKGAVGIAGGAALGATALGAGTFLSAENKVNG